MELNTGIGVLWVKWSRGLEAFLKGSYNMELPRDVLKEILKWRRELMLKDALPKWREEHFDKLDDSLYFIRGEIVEKAHGYNVTQWRDYTVRVVTRKRCDFWGELRWYLTPVDCPRI